MTDYGPGERPWLRGSEARRTTGPLANTVFPPGSIAVTDEGFLYVADGVTKLKSLIPLANLTVTNGLATLIAALQTQVFGGVQPIQLASFSAAAGFLYPVDATGGAVTATLADATLPGQVVSFSKLDATTAAVTVSARLRGAAAASTISMTTQHEALVLVSKFDGSWYPIANLVTKTAMDAAYKGVSAATASTNMARDASGRAKVAAPAAADDIARLDTVTSAIAGLVNSSPAALDTLKELADALGDDPNFATTVNAAISARLVAANNLSDLTNAALARTNLGLGTAALRAVETLLQAANNLSDLANAGTARTNLGLGTAAVQNVGTFLQKANNLSDVASPATSRTNLGLGSAALLNADQAARSARSLRPANALRENYSRSAGVSFVTGTGILVAGQLTLIAMPLYAGDLVSSLAVYIGTSSASPTNAWLALFDSGGNLKGISADDTTTIWAANSRISRAIAQVVSGGALTPGTNYTVAADEVHYIGVLNAGTTPAQLLVPGGAGNSGPMSQIPVLVSRDTSHTGLTTPATCPLVATFNTTLGQFPYAMVA